MSDTSGGSGATAGSAGAKQGGSAGVGSGGKAAAGGAAAAGTPTAGAPIVTDAGAGNGGTECGCAGAGGTSGGRAGENSSGGSEPAGKGGESSSAGAGGGAGAANACDEPGHIGATCDDHDACTIVDECQPDSSCIGTPKSCDDANPCTDDSCDPLSGCRNVPNSASCDDGGACTNGDRCGGGTCTGALVAGCSIGAEDFGQYGGAAAYSKAQSFIAPAAQISRVDVYAPSSAAARWEVRIVSALPAVDPTSPGHVLAQDRDQKTLGVASVLSSSAGWVTLTLPVPAQVTPGKLYFLFMENGDAAFGFGSMSNWSRSVDGTNPYTFGDGFIHTVVGSDWIKVGATGSEDYAFHVWP